MRNTSVVGVIFLLSAIASCSGGKPMNQRHPAAGQSELRTGRGTIMSITRYTDETTYFVKVGSVIFSAEKRGAACDGFFTGDQVDVSYDQLRIALVRGSKVCQLSIRSSF